MSWLLLTRKKYSKEGIYYDKCLVNTNRINMISGDISGRTTMEFNSDDHRNYEEKFEDIKEFIRQEDLTLDLQLDNMENTKEHQDNKVIKLFVESAKLDNEHKLELINKLTNSIKENDKEAQ